MSFDVQKIRADFPILNLQVYGKQLVYLDNGATTQKPQCVIDVESEYYKTLNSNIHRGIHFLSGKSTIAYEEARKTVKEFINAEHSHEIIFTHGTTESINLVAFSFGEKYIHAGDEIIVSEMEHHSNIVPWQMLCERKNAVLKVIPFDDNGELILDEFKKLLSDKTKFVSVSHVSNTLGTVNPVEEIINITKTYNPEIAVLIDGAQSIQHIAIDVQKLNCDFFVFSGHKIYSPTGIGILYGKEKLLNAIPPYQGGGDMIKNVSFAGTTWADLPFKFEAGTVNFTGAIAMSRAIKYINQIGIDNIAAHEHLLLTYATDKLKEVNHLHIYGQAKNKSCVISFLLNKVHPYDVGMILDKLGIAVRTGTHCTEPIMQHFGIVGTVRASFALYNTVEEIDYLVQSMKKVETMFF